ncbi:MAG: hypothetical protein HN855_07335 [Anaerolineae bacterium]|jgi:hypothetical protein|nr:hypothetical protein [Anaerolineae bacterium]MBT7070220.1 hypothetical protein [Anaerolineae bacterium]MBT7324951.1 hypothetical protein [Anaerolineae bacterium]
MKIHFSNFVILTLLVFSLVACGSAEPTLSVDEQVMTAVAATATAEASFENAVSDAVAATVVAMPPTPTPGPTVEYYELSEEELAALIDEAVEEAVVATEASSAATTQATSDGTMTSEEVYETAAYVYDAEAAIYYAEELIAAYYDLYGAYAEDVLYLLTAIEDDLDTLIYALEEVEDILLQGAEVASTAIAQLDEAASAMSTHIAESQADRDQFLEQVKTNLDSRENTFADIAPGEIAGDLNGTLTQLHDYLDTIKVSFGDRKIDPTEMFQIAQLGANAQASILANGGPQLQNIGGSIDGLTRQLSRGEWPQANRSLGGFEASLPSRPSRR